MNPKLVLHREPFEEPFQALTEEPFEEPYEWFSKEPLNGSLFVPVWGTLFGSSGNRLFLECTVT